MRLESTGRFGWLATESTGYLRYKTPGEKERNRLQAFKIITVLPCNPNETLPHMLLRRLPVPYLLNHIVAFIRKPYCSVM